VTLIQDRSQTPAVGSVDRDHRSGERTFGGTSSPARNQCTGRHQVWGARPGKYFSAGLPTRSTVLAGDRAHLGATTEAQVGRLLPTERRREDDNQKIEFNPTHSRCCSQGLPKGPAVELILSSSSPAFPGSASSVPRPGRSTPPSDCGRRSVFDAYTAPVNEIRRWQTAKGADPT
jgi:hypothetical protein